ncbi:hypothetical protein BGZ91_011410 [Linnemannia elongata]|nr:hypothetical protein BGZ91_011410 [Linnemannia elongata]
MNQISVRHEMVSSEADYDEKEEYDEKDDDIEDSVDMGEEYEVERPLVDAVRLGPFNIKEHTLIGITVSTAATAAYAIVILSAMDRYLNYRINTLGSLVLILTTQCIGYGMAGMLRKYLVYPAEMVWWSNLVQVVFYNAVHNTDEFRARRMIRGFSYMNFFRHSPLLVFFDWACWIAPFNKNVWAIFSSISGGGVFSLSFDWNAIGGTILYYPLSAQLCNFAGNVISYWIILPIMWLTNALGTRTFGRPLTPELFFQNGTKFDIKPVLKPDHSLDVGNHWKRAVGGEGDDIHTRMMRVYPEVPQLWYAAFYIAMAGLAIFVCEMYIKQLPWWGLLVALAMGWVLTLPICAMQAITGSAPALNITTELVCGYILPGKPIANMAFKVYGYMTMYHIFNYLTMILIIDSQRGILNGTKDNPTGLWTGQRVGTFWGSGLIFGALGPPQMFASSGNYGFVYYGFLGMTAYPYGYTFGIFPSLIACLVFRFYMFRYHQGWWQKYALILASALDTGTAFTSVVLFLFISGDVSPRLTFDPPHWWGTYANKNGTTAPYMFSDRCPIRHSGFS